MTDRAATRICAVLAGHEAAAGVVAALLPSPESLILDEPRTAWTRRHRRDARPDQVVRRRRDHGAGIEPPISENQQVCDHAVMIRGGRLVHQGTDPTLRRTASGHRDRARARRRPSAPREDLEARRPLGRRPARPTALSAVVRLCASAAELNRPAAPTASVVVFLQLTHSLEGFVLPATGMDSAIPLPGMVPLNDRGVLPQRVGQAEAQAPPAVHLPWPGCLRHPCSWC